jgi:hypothetical protein
MAAQNKTDGTQARPTCDSQTAPPPAAKSRFHRLGPHRRLCLVAGGYVVTATLCGLAGYLWRAPLPSIVVSQNRDANPAPALTAGRAGSKASFESCLRQVKTRDLFKPSVPVPSESGIGKSTAQELAGRLQFVGVMEAGGGLAALVFIPNRGPGTFRVGDRVAEFVLKDIQADQLTLELGDEKAVLKR